MMKNIESTEKEKKKGLIVSTLTFAFVFILLYTSSFDASKKIVEALPITVEIPLSEIFEQVIKKQTSIQGGHGGGGGESDDSPISKTPKPQSQNLLTSTDGIATKLPKGNSKHNTGDNKTNTSTSVKHNSDPNPFADGGDGPGEGGGNGKGKGTGMGEDTGDGSGKGKGNDSGDGDGSARIRKNDPTSEIETDANCKICLKVTINENGEVISAKNLLKLTTTTNQKIIDEAIRITKEQTRYNKKPGAGLETANITIRLFAK